MKKIFTLLFILSLSLVGCDSYLDRQPDDQLTSDSIWEKQGTTLQYLWNVYGYMRDEAELASDGPIDSYVSDEAGGSFPNWFYGEMLFETFNPGNVRSDLYNNQYVGIHEATVFIENVDRCPELSAAEKKAYKAEARFMRAYYYFYIMKNFGPTFFPGNSVSEALESDVYKADRATWDFLVDYVCNELDLAYEDLPVSREIKKEYGRATKGAAKAIKARLLLYSARPLFNGQNGTGMYDDIVNLKGEKIFNTTYDRKRWEYARDAALEVIQMNYSLENSSAKTGVERGLENLTTLFVTNPAPSEYIWTYQKDGIAWRRKTFPQNMVEQVDGWASLSPTQKLVDAFAMASGVYPVKPGYWDSEEYAHGKNVDPTNSAQVDSRAVAEGYSESGSTSIKNPLYTTLLNEHDYEIMSKPTMNQFVGREARFYRNVGWSGMQYIAGDATITTTGRELEFYTGGKNAQPNANNVPPFGYLALKLYDPTLNPRTNGWGTFTWPIVRLANVYLDYVECLNELDGDVDEMLSYWNQIRERAGVPAIETVYPEVRTDKVLRTELLRRERMIELCFENHRWIDCRTWMIAEQTNDGYMIGCNSKAGTDAVDSDYWQRVEIGKDEYAYGEAKKMGARVFTRKSYLLPFPQSEVNKVPALRNSQNLGW